MPEINVTFQGGGVYLAKMLPIAHALQNLHESGLITIRGVAGASAGSICAALLAARCDFEELRNVMCEHLESDAKKLANRYYEPLGLFGVTATLYDVWNGKDLINRRELRSFIKKMFQTIGSCPQSVETFHNDDGYADLYVAKAKLVPDYLEIEKNGDLFDALVDSCSIPFALKNYVAASKHFYVDGGLCENLPIKCFNSEDDIPIFAVSVSSMKKTDHASLNLLTYLLRLFSATVGYSVTRSKETIGTSFCLDEGADFEFHEIKKAVEWYCDENEYNNVKNKFESRLRGFAEYNRVSRAGAVFLSGESTLTKRNNDFKALFSGTYDSSDWIVNSSTMFLIAHSADRNAAPGANRTDIVQFISNIQTQVDAPKMYKSHIFLAGNRLHPTSWIVSNKTKGKKNIPFRAVHYQDVDDGGSDVDPCFLIFENPEDHISKNDVLEIMAIQPVLPGATMDGLVGENKEDFVVMNNRHNESIELLIVLKYPREVGELEPQPREGNLVDFRSMTEEQLFDYTNRYDAEFNVKGVCSTEKVRTGDRLAIDFKVK